MLRMYAVHFRLMVVEQVRWANGATLSMVGSPNAYHTWAVVAASQRNTDERMAMLTMLNPPGGLIPGDHPIGRIRVVVDAVLAELDDEFVVMYAMTGRFLAAVVAQAKPRCCVSSERFSVDGALLEAW